MRLRPYFGQTYLGIVTIGLTFAGVCGLVSAAMFMFRPICEPILRFALTLFVHSVAHSYFRYDPATYWFWAGYIGALGVLFVAVFVIAIIRKPAQDRRIDEALRRQTTEISHGAPLEPE